MQEEESPQSQTLKTTRRDCIREAFKVKQVPLVSLDIMLASVCKSMKKHYKSSLEKWIKFTEMHGIDSFKTEPQELILFSTKRFDEGCSLGCPLFPKLKTDDRPTHRV